MSGFMSVLVAGNQLFKTVTIGNAGSETGYRASSYGSIVPDQFAGGKTLLRARSLLLANFEIEFSGTVGTFNFAKIEVQNSAGSIITLTKASASFCTTGTPSFGYSWGDGSAGVWVPADVATKKQLRFYL